MEESFGRARKVAAFFLSVSLLLVAQGCIFGSSEPASESETTNEGDTSYRMSLRGSIFGSVSEKDIRDALPDSFSDKDLVPQFVGRGKYLALASGCGSCHGQRAGDPSSPLSGGQEIRDRFGSVLAANLTPAKPGGLGDWSLREIGSAIRSSLAKDERPISLDVHQAYRWLSDIDTLAIAAYLKSLRPVRNDIDRRQLGTFEKSSMGLISRHQPIFGYVPSPATNNPREYGRYLVQHVAACATCHTPESGLFTDGELLSGRELDEEHNVFPRGGPDIRGKKGLKAWSAQDIVAYLDTGVTPSKKKTDGKLCPWPFFHYLTEKDKQAIAGYLKAQ